MNILYVAKHGSGGNNDEDAISFALRKLGHDVECVQEKFSHHADVTATRRTTGQRDFCLFHHWHDTRSMENLHKCMPLVFWNFDLVEWPDPTLEARNVIRRTWMHEVMKVVDLGFCTDGDWVAKHPDRLVWLPQGFDERQKMVVTEKKGPSILFTGIGKSGGTQRESFVNEMQDRYGSEFLHYIKGLHGDKLAKAIAEAKIVVAPDSPVTDKYWSNRVYNVLGMGGFLLHPYSEGITKQYRSMECVTYQDRQHLHLLIDYYLNDNSQAREVVADIGRQQTLKAHTYTRRCEVLIATVKARLGA